MTFKAVIKELRYAKYFLQDGFKKKYQNLNSSSQRDIKNEIFLINFEHKYVKS